MTAGKNSKTLNKNQDAPLIYNWKYILDIVRLHKRELYIANILAILSALAAVPIPLLMPLMVDEVLLEQPGIATNIIDSIFPESLHGPVLYILIMLLLTASLRLFSTLLGVWQTKQFTSIAKDITYRMRRTLLKRLGCISMSEYETLGSAQVASHFVTDMETIDQFVGATVAKFVVAVLMIIGIASVLIWVNWQLGLFILLMNPVVIYFTVSMGKKVKNLKSKENKAFELFQSSLTETLDAIQQIRASNREQHFLSKVIDRAKGVRDDSTAFAWKSDAANRLSFLIFLIGFEMFRAVSMLMVVFSDLTIGLMMAVFGYLWFMMGPVQDILSMQYSYQAAKAALHRINRLFELRKEPQYEAIEDPFIDKNTVSIEVKDITFGYDENQKVLNQLSILINKGEKVALVGASGGGKSTLVQVLLGLYTPTKGQIFYDGIEVSKIGLEKVRDNIAVVLQHPAIFNDSVRLNLTMGQTLSDEKLWQALEIAQLDGDISAMTLGLDSVIGRQGVRLSGGQRQRLAIARMILMDPSIVILDEATSALDAETEARLHRAMDAFLHGRTTLIVAHRLSAVKEADRVYVFEDGHIIEEGQHEELIGSGGLYSKLYGRYQH